MNHEETSNQVDNQEAGNGAGMLDRATDCGATFDWITPTWTLIQDCRNGPSTGYNIPVDGGWSAYAIEDLMKAHGIKVWGLSIFNKKIMFRCRQAQAGYAQYLIERQRHTLHGWAE